MAILLPDEEIARFSHGFLVFIEFKIKIELIGMEGKRHFHVRNKKREHLGWINYYPKWKKYVFTTPDRELIFDSDCLYTIENFMRTMDNFKAE